MAISSPGIGSNLDVNTIISQLMALEQRPLTQLSLKEASFQAKLSAFGSLKGSISAFQASLSGLASQARFETLSAKPADAAIFSATAASSATRGNFNVTVSTLARSQVLNAAGMASATATSSTGTVSLQIGDGSPRTITINNSNNTLEGLRDAINAAGAGVSAAIINDGSSMPYRLSLTASASGLDNAITFTHTLSDGALKDALDGIAESQSAQDATLTVNGIAISRPTNTLEEAIPGVTLRLLKEGTTTLTVASDTSGIQTAVQSFVKGYNDLNKTNAALTAYNPETRQGGTLVGDSSALSVQTQLRAALGSAIDGLTGPRTTLSQIGLTIQLDGTMALDSAKLSAALNAAPGGVGSLFAAQGSSDNELLAYVRSTAASTAGNYQVHISAAAKRATVTATTAVAASTVIDDESDDFQVQINGVSSGTVQIAHGTYTPAQLASALQTALAGSSSLSAAGISPTVAAVGGKITISSDTYGTSSTVSNAAGTATAALGYTGAEQATGSNVAGYFYGNGAKSAATGVGQELAAAPGSMADGLVVRYSGDQAQLQASNPPTLRFTEGYAIRLDRLASRLLENTGPIANRTSGIDRSIANIEDQKERFNQRMIAVERRIRAQFTALDTLISRLSNTSNFLTQQLANLPGSNSRN